MDHLSQGDAEIPSESSPAESNGPRTHTETEVQLATRTETAFSCRRWYRLTGKSIKPDDELTHILPSTRFLSTAPARPQNSNTWTRIRRSEPQPFSPSLPQPFNTSSPRDKARFNSSRPSTHKGVYGMMSPLMPASKWSSSDGYHFDAQSMQQLAKRVYATKASTVKRRKEQEKKALKHHIYLPAVEKTLKMFQSPRQNNAFAQDLPPEYESGKSTESRLTGKREHPAPIGANLLSSQVKTLQEELVRQSAQEASGLHGTSNASSPALWCPQPPRTAPNASYRSSRFVRPPQNGPAAQDSSSSSDDSNWATSSLLFSDSCSSQQEISEFHYIAVPSGGSDSRDSASSLETHVLGVLEGCDHDSSSRMDSCDNLRFGLKSEDDDDLALLQAIESASLENQKELFQEGRTSDVLQPTPFLHIASQDPGLEATEPDDLNSERSDLEIPSTATDEVGQEDQTIRGEVVRAESPDAIQEPRIQDETRSALVGEASGEDNGNPTSPPTSHPADDATERSAQTGDIPVLEEEGAREPWSVDASEVSAMDHEDAKSSEIVPTAPVADEVPSVAMVADEAREERRGVHQSTSGGGYAQDDAVGVKLAPQLCDLAPDGSTSSPVMIMHERRIYQDTNLNDAPPANADDATEGASQGGGPVVFAETTLHPVELAGGSSPMETSVNDIAFQNEAHREEVPTTAAEGVAEFESIQPLPDSPALSELDAVVFCSGEASPAKEEQHSQDLQSSLQMLFQQIASDTAPFDDSETTPAPDASGPQAGNDYEADFEDGEDEEDAQDDPEFYEFEDES